MMNRTVVMRFFAMGRGVLHSASPMRARRMPAAAALFALAGCAEAPPPPPPPPPPVVSVVDVVQKDVPIFVEWVGTIDGDVNAQIRARVKGYLQTRDYPEGTSVAAGALLFKIDSRPYVAALDRARGELARANASLTKSEQDVARYTPLAAEGAISREELDNAVQARRAAEAAVESARAVVETAQLDLDWTEIRSPIAGIAGIALVNVGDLVNENTILTTVSQLDPVRVSFSISEQEYLRLAGPTAINKAERIVKEGTLELILADSSVFPHRGTATVANREVDIRTGTLTVIGQFPNPGNLLRPGQYAKVRATIETRPGALLVPQRAVQEVQGTYQVAVVGADNVVSMRSVTPGPRVGTQWLIEGGLNPGERVIVEGLQKVRNGLTVAPTPAPAAAQP
jgi:membrane fusion protein (multidrug efflux system)